LLAFHVHFYISTKAGIGVLSNKDFKTPRCLKRNRFIVLLTKQFVIHKWPEHIVETIYALDTCNVYYNFVYYTRVIVSLCFVNEALPLSPSNIPGADWLWLAHYQSLYLCSWSDSSLILFLGDSITHSQTNDEPWQTSTLVVKYLITGKINI